MQPLNCLKFISSLYPDIQTGPEMTVWQHLVTDGPACIWCSPFQSEGLEEAHTHTHSETKTCNQFIWMQKCVFLRQMCICICRVFFSFSHSPLLAHPFLIFKRTHRCTRTHAPFLWESGVNQWVDFQWVIVTGPTGQIDDGKEEKMKTENGFSKSKHVHHLLLSALCMHLCVHGVYKMCVHALRMAEVLAW